MARTATTSRTAAGSRTLAGARSGATGRSLYTLTWSGMGMHIIQLAGNTAEYDGWIDTLLLNGIYYFREIPNRQSTPQVDQTKANITRNSAKTNAKFIWGVSSNTFDHDYYCITAENWTTHANAVKSAATWAEDNGVYEFQIGNEEEWHHYYRQATGSLVRSGNVTTVTTATAHGFDGTHQVTVENATPATFNGTFDITVVDTTHFTYANAGDNGSNTSATQARVMSITRAEIITNLKALATEVQAIYTIGNVSYSCAHAFIGEWVTAGRGDIDFIASNIYIQSNGAIAWEDEVDTLVAGFGVDHCYITEFAPDGVAITNYSADEDVQAAGVSEMLEYIKASGITRANFFMWKHPTTEFGVLRTSDGGYRELWQVLKGTYL